MFCYRLAISPMENRMSINQDAVKAALSAVIDPNTGKALVSSKTI